MKRVLCPKCENYLYFDEPSIAKANHWYLNANIVASNSVSG